MKTIECAVCGALGLMAVTIAQADSAEELKQRLQQAHPGTEFSAVLETPVTGLFEVRMRDNIAYVLATHPRYFLFGELLDGQTLTVPPRSPANGEPVGPKP